MERNCGGSPYCDRPSYKFSSLNSIGAQKHKMVKLLRIVPPPPRVYCSKLDQRTVLRAVINPLLISNQNIQIHVQR